MCACVTVIIGEGDCQTGGYTVLNDAWRSVNNHVSSYNDWKNIHCDINLPTGWYRIQFNGVDHKIPNYCLLPNVDVPLICGSHVPMWYNDESFKSFIKQKIPHKIHT